MNIWIVDHYSSEPVYGGISRQYDFARELARRGHRVLVLASAFSHFTHSYITQEAYKVTPIADGAYYAYLHTSSYRENSGRQRLYNTLSFVRAVRQQRDALAKQCFVPEVVVGCSIHPFAWVAAYRAAQHFQAHFVAEVRDLWPAAWIYNRGMSPHHPKAVFFGWLERWAYDRAERILYSMSRGDRYICDILGYPRDKAIWMDQPMDCERFDRNAGRYAELPEDMRRFIGDAFLCVFTGYYMTYEGVYAMLEAAGQIEEKQLPIRFVFVGSGAEEEGMRTYVQEHHLQNVYIGQRLPKEWIPALLRRAGICLAHLAVQGNPGSYPFDASKNKINEYMYADACILYGTYVEKQFVQTSGAGYTIEPYSAAAFAEKIEEVYAMDAGERAVFGQKARAYLLEHNTVEKLIDRYTEVLYEVCKPDSPVR